MKKKTLPSFIALFGLTFIISCSKEVKTPYSKPASAAKTTSSPVTEAPSQSQSENGNTCGSNSGASSNQSGY